MPRSFPSVRHTLPPGLALVVPLLAAGLPAHAYEGVEQRDSRFGRTARPEQLTTALRAAWRQRGKQPGWFGLKGATESISGYFDERQRLCGVFYARDSNGTQECRHSLWTPIQHNVSTGGGTARRTTGYVREDDRVFFAEEGGSVHVDRVYNKRPSMVFRDAAGGFQIYDGHSDARPNVRRAMTLTASTQSVRHEGDEPAKRPQTQAEFAPVRQALERGDLAQAYLKLIMSKQAPPEVTWLGSLD